MLRRSAPGLRLQSDRTFGSAVVLPNDQVGLYTFPTGPWVPPSTDRVELRRKLDAVVGNRQAIQSQFGFRRARKLTLGLQRTRADHETERAENALESFGDQDASIRVI